MKPSQKDEFQLVKMRRGRFKRMNFKASEDEKTAVSVLSYMRIFESCVTKKVPFSTSLGV